MGIKFGGWALNRHCKNIGRFKFGGSVRDHHTYIYKYEILADFNLAGCKLDHQTAKFNSLPNFPAIRYQPKSYSSISKWGMHACKVI